MHLALDHLTVGDAYPWEIAELAGECGLQGCCVFLESMAVLPNLPEYSLIENKAQRAQMQRALRNSGVALDLVYPFTLTGRSQISDFRAGLETAAELSAGAVNLLVYDRQPDRARQNVGAFVEQAGSYGLEVAVEFYPASAVASLELANALLNEVDDPCLGINVDILHLYRSGSSIDALATAGGRISFAQLADGLLAQPDDPVFEAAEARLDLGEGEFNLAGFIRALPPVKISLEVPNAKRLGRAGAAPVQAVAHRFHDYVQQAMK